MNYKLKTKNIFLVLLMFIFISSIWMVSYGGDDILIKESELEKLNDKIKELDQNIGEKGKENNALISNINSIQRNIRTLEDEIALTDADIENTEISISEKEGIIAEAENNISEKTVLLNSRIRVMYKNGNVGYLEVLLGSKDFKDLLSRIDMVQKIYLHDKNLINYMKEQKDIVTVQKKELEEKKETLVSYRKVKSEKTTVLNEKIGTLRDAQKEVKKDLVALEKQEKEFEKDAKKLTEIIRSMKLAADYVGGEMMWPTPGYYNITSPFGNRIHPILKTKKLHTGIDIAVPYGNAIHAAQSGTVVFTGWMGSYGKAVLIDHGGGIATLYAHNSSIVAKKGQKVIIGDVISKCGSTGRSTGAHLHFEVRKNGEYVDPLGYVKGK